MNINYLFGFQVITDLAICAGILYLTFRFHKLFKEGFKQVSEDSIHEFKKLLDESKDNSDKFLEEMKKEKIELKQLLHIIEEKKENLKSLLEKESPRSELGEKKREDVSPTLDDHYSQILNLSKQGLDEKQISHQLGLPEGEVGLILNLTHQKNK
jgi:hypothetical protein